MRRLFSVIRSEFSYNRKNQFATEQLLLHTVAFIKLFLLCPYSSKFRKIILQFSIEQTNHRSWYFNRQQKKGQFGINLFMRTIGDTHLAISPSV